ncbi:4'-phosphopantetheinyl transferase superfamily protein [Mesorhizobium sp. M0204]|uniref:4'-phosphopantetheinyl transferase family protein n=1 Tax=unclassified Mesorhizobium TaxID=325217 RepID=UPI003337AC3E
MTIGNRVLRLKVPMDRTGPQRVAETSGAEAIRAALSGALGTGEEIAVLVVPLDSVPPSLDLLHPLERPAVERAVDKRIREFVAGRLLAREAALLLGLSDLVLPAGRDRAPVWPPGIVGSITHSRRWCAVAMARTRDVAGLGLDIEEHPGVPERLAPEIMTKPEIDSCNRLAAAERDLMRSFVFSAKEAAFKAQYGLTKTMFYFQDVDTRIDMDRLAFSPAYNLPGVADRLQGFARSCGLFHLHGLVGSAVKLTDPSRRSGTAAPEISSVPLRAE